MASLAISRDRFKGAVHPCALMARGLPAFAPLGTVFNDPIRQGALKADIMAGLFGFNPFVFQNLFTLRLKFAVEGRVLYQIIATGGIWSVVRHKPR